MKIKENFDIKEFCSFGIGGKARYFCIVKTKNDLIEAVEFAKHNNVEIYIHGGGTNVLFSDGIINKLFIKINNLNIEEIQNEQLLIGSGVTWTLLNSYLKKHKIYGLEPLVGIPGTIGGAIYGNAGSFGMETSDPLIEVEYFDIENNKFKTVNKNDITFDYRTSSFKSEHLGVIWQSIFHISKNSKDQKGDDVDYKNRRESSQPYGKTTGSFFKNPKGDFAGRLIQEAGLKGFKIGGIEVSEKHANFFINDGTATFEDVIQLKKHIET
jgi:UDP-N-acetylmuramate dehydrogenase